MRLIKINNKNMQDLGMIFLVWFSIPLSLLINSLLLFPFPRFLKLYIQRLNPQIFTGFFIASLVVFTIYAAFFYLEEDHIVGETVAIRLEAKAREWRKGRNFYSSFFNFVNWAVVYGTLRLRKKIEAINAKNN
ncbi:unnamed protein product [Blepharisma stoltei]|uniref:Uncharacterized protein n=1 Tax=Blepharisma stoltei TaxID=1481888 RepID=A0AAU9JI03_9CILI|nr:unnamed protein product [Blepharisma stoltei]